VREALGIVAVRADDKTVCLIDYLHLADPKFQAAAPLCGGLRRASTP
jgi:hypothetical protein